MMAGPNSEPIFSRVADVQWVDNIVTANNTIDITAGTSYLVFTADSTNGGFVRNARVKVNPANNTAATVVRFWLNNGLTTGTSANSAIIGELGLPATVTSATSPQADFDYPLNFAMPPGYRLYVTVGTAPGGSSEITVAIFGGKY
jgi:hypothetical protein